MPAPAALGKIAGMQQLRIIWFALLASTLIYCFIAWTMSTQHAARPFDESVRSPMVLGLYGIGLVDFVLATMVSIAMRDRPLRLRMILSMALYEACAIFGLVAAFLTQDWRIYLAPWALTIIGFLRMFPTAEDTRLTP